MKICELCTEEISVYSRYCKPHASDIRKARDRNRKRQTYSDGVAYQKVKDRQLAQREIKRLIVCDYLSDNPCIDCGQSDIIVLDFDHRGDDHKVSGVVAMMNNGCSPGRMIGEIAKCDIRCANCHRKKTISSFDGTYRTRYLSRRI